MEFAVAEDQEFTLPPLEERPLVTFALFAYNQEKYIREAVEGAFAQTYEPLEIILSDDCSTDRTFEIMEEMAAGYRGPHRVAIRKSPKNRRIIGHINDVVSLAQGEIIIMAAGDDISLPSRTLRITQEFKWNKEICGVFTAYQELSSEKIIDYSIPKKTIIPKIEHAINLGGIGLGATYAYRRECFFLPAPMDETLKLEDRILPLRAAVLGSVIFINDPLVIYRVTHVASEEKARKTIDMSIENQRSHISLIIKDLDSLAKLRKISPLSSFTLKKAILGSYWWRGGFQVFRLPSIDFFFSNIFMAILRSARRLSRKITNKPIIKN